MITTVWRGRIVHSIACGRIVLVAKRLGGETSRWRTVQGAKRPAWARTGAKRKSGETSCYLPEYCNTPIQTKLCLLFHTALRDCADMWTYYDPWGFWQPYIPENGLYTLFVGPQHHQVRVFRDMDGGGWTVNIKTFLSLQKYKLLV